MENDKYNLEPAFDFAASESSHLIQEGKAEINIEENTYAGKGEVRLDLSPRARIYVYGHFEEFPAEEMLKGSDSNLIEIQSFLFEGLEIEGIPQQIAVKQGSQRELKVKWRPETETLMLAGSDSTYMKRLVFHVFNFKNFTGTRNSTELYEGGMHLLEHVDLVSNAWQVELKSLPTTRDNIKVLEESGGGYRLTHIGCVEKVNGTEFSGKEADEFLVAFQFILSFVKGGVCNPVYSVGFGESDLRVWESWSSPREPWHSSLSWFDSFKCSQLELLFPAFMNAWANEDWREALLEVIYWYTLSNNTSLGIDAGIILTQAALERLSFEFAVNDRRLITKPGFKKLWASDKYRLLFSSLNIPLDIPAGNIILLEMAGEDQMNWSDAAQALTEIRNSLVHPDHSRRVQLKAAHVQAWNLGLWFLEMSLLALCGYSSTYGNRLKYGQVEDVPWQLDCE